MATFNNGESGSSIRTKINNVLQHLDGTSGAVVVNDAGADVDFRVESDTNPNALFVDGATGNVGIGTGSPTQRLDVRGNAIVRTSDATSANNAGVLIQGAASATASSRLATIVLDPNGADSLGTDYSVVRMSGDGQFELNNFLSSGFMTLKTNNTERMRIDSSGNVLVGTTSSPSGSGQIVANGGIYLGGTGAANLLDDYEEGTWTPVLTGSTSGTLNLTGGSYTKIGNLVTVRVLNNNKIDSGTLVGNLSITGLPFTVDNLGSGNHFCQSNGLLHIRGATSTGAAGAPFAALVGTGIKLHSSSNLGSTAVTGSAAPTFPATGITQNGVTAVIIDWVFAYTVA